MKELLYYMALFVATVRAGGFSRAAENVGMAKSTLSTRISALESSLGLRLLNRTTRKIELTEAGQIYFDQACAILDEAENLRLRLHNLRQQPAGTITLTTTDDFGKIFLANVIDEFCAEYPQIRLDIHLSQTMDDLISQRFDLAIRMGRMPDSNLIAQQIGTTHLRLYATPEYIEKIGNPNTPNQLPNSDYILFKSDFVSEIVLNNNEKSVVIPVSGILNSNSPGMNAQLAMAGNGIALLPDLVAYPLLQQGRLKAILPQYQSSEQPIYAVTTNRLLPEKTLLLINFLKEKLKMIYFQAA